ncbi:MAG: lysophospholipid acyltransferase family protein [Myxococcaceae bacterium]|nr:lysophospholipid acyltransferase family protein [Myxococcaceae bacterium]
MARRPDISPGGPLGRLAVGVLLRWVRWLEPDTRGLFASALARVAFTLGIRRAVALDNLRRALPERTDDARLAIARSAYESLGRAAVEAVTSDLVPDALLRRLVEVADWKGLDQLLDARAPVLIASAHLGSWELFAEVMARRGHALSAVVRPLAGAFNEWVVRNRKAAGVELILQRGALRRMLAALARGRAVVQLIDQVLPAKDGVFVPFFGRPACTSPAIAMAARVSRAPVYVVAAVREGEGLRMLVEGPVPMVHSADRDADLVANTAALTAIVEATIRRYPEQWLWLHRRWKVQPPA